jgi:hypothetical protein
METPNAHYHGNKVRKIFLVSGLVMLIGLPVFALKLQFAIFAAVLGILIVGLFAGLTSPHNKFAIIFDVVISLIGILAFEATAVLTYSNWGADGYFAFNQFLAILFFVALYFSVRSARDMLKRPEAEYKP